MALFHAAVWLDHQEARIFGLGGDEVEHEVVHSHAPHVHARSPIEGDRRVHDQPAYFQAIAEKLAQVREILLMGPAGTKDEFKAYLDRHDPGLAARVVGVETVGRHSEGETIAIARGAFMRIDRMTPQLQQ
jgi:hypothetical protein